MMNSKQLTQQVFEALNAWSKANPTTEQVLEVLQTLESAIDNMPTILRVGVGGGKLVTLNSMIMDSLCDLCGIIEEEQAAQEKEEESPDDQRDYQREFNFDALTNRTGVFRMMGLI